MPPKERVQAYQVDDAVVGMARVLSTPPDVAISSTNRDWEWPGVMAAAPEPTRTTSKDPTEKAAYWVDTVATGERDALGKLDDVTDEEAPAAGEAVGEGVAGAAAGVFEGEAGANRSASPIGGKKAPRKSVFAGAVATVEMTPVSESMRITWVVLVAYKT